jgi:hypothetical protein
MDAQHAARRGCCGLKWVGTQIAPWVCAMTQSTPSLFLNPESRRQRSLAPSQERALKDLRIAGLLRVEALAMETHAKQELEACNALLDADAREESGEFARFVDADAALRAAAALDGTLKWHGFVEPSRLEKLSDGDTLVEIHAPFEREVIEWIDDADLIERTDEGQDFEIVYADDALVEARAEAPIPFELVTPRDGDDAPVAYVSRRRIWGARLLFVLFFGGVLGLLGYEGLVTYRSGARLGALGPNTVRVVNS